LGFSGLFSGQISTEFPVKFLAKFLGILGRSGAPKKCSKNSCLFSFQSGVAEMDENQLKNLLEEAINYKKPSDIETKSECFKVTILDPKNPQKI
jgi:hypothetical protein